jgi:ribosomal peptide maturation radical SAM protein 1
LSLIPQLRGIVSEFLRLAVEEVLAFSPRVVGFTVSFSQTTPSLVLSKMLKDRVPDLHVVFGGANCDGAMGAALQRSFPWVDTVVQGEGDYVLPRLLERLLGVDSTGLPTLNHDGTVTGLVSSPARADLDSLPLPDYDDYFDRLNRSPSLAEAVGPRIRIPIENARGCWWGQKHHCTFCGLNGTVMTFRSKNPARVCDEIVALARHTKILDFEAVDNIIDMKYISSLLPMLRDLRGAGLDLTLFYETKSNLRREHLRTMRDAGIVRIQPGIESLSTPILRLMKKGVSAMQNIRLLKWATEFGIRANWNIIYGIPGEAPSAYGALTELVPALTHLKPPNLVRLQLERFSPYFERPEQYGLRVTGPMPAYDYLYDYLDEETRADLAYRFTYDYVDGRDPEHYVQDVRDAIEMWQSAHNHGSFLRYVRGPEFIRILDARPNLEGGEYILGEVEAIMYLSCGEGATLKKVQHVVREMTGTSIAISEIRAFLRELVHEKLMYEEQDRFLSLATASNPDASDLIHAPIARAEEPSMNQSPSAL